MKHYVYRITNIVENKHYYGSRSSLIEPNMDIGVLYFSSSLDKDFITDQKLNKHNYKYKVVKTFRSRNEAIKYEVKLHNLFNVDINESFYNRRKQGAVDWDRTGKKHTAQTKQKMSEKAIGRVGANKGVVFDEEWRQNLSKNHANFSGSSNPNYGNKWSEEMRKKVSEKHKNRKRVICPYCKKESDISNMTRWHFSNCKEAKNEL